MNAFANVLLTPFLLAKLGVSEFGLYQLVFSFVGYLTILNFGTGVVTNKFISKYRVQRDKIGEENFLATIFLITGLLTMITLIIGVIIVNNLSSIFVNLTVDEVFRAKNVFILMVINIAILMFVSNFEGLTIAYEKYKLPNVIKIVRLLIRVGMIVLLINAGYSIIAIASIDLILSVFTLVINFLYSKIILKVRIKLHKIDKSLINSTLFFSLALVIQAIVGQINLNVDKVILGIMTSTEIVALYSLAMIIFSFFNMLTSSLYNFYVPEAVFLVNNDASGEELTNFVIKPGRFIFMIIGGIFLGFFLFGKYFVILWVGEAFLDIWKITLLLMAPAIIPMIQSVCVSILNAKDKRMFRSVISVLIGVINVIATIFLVRYMGYFGAAIATSVALILGDIIVMNLYYSKVLKIKVVYLFKGIFKGILPSLLITYLISIPLTIIYDNNILTFLLSGIIYLIIYLTTIYIFGLNDSEKVILKSLLKKIHIKKVI